MVAVVLVLALAINALSLLALVDERIEPTVSLDGEVRFGDPVIVNVNAVVSAAMLLAAGVLWARAARRLHPVSWTGLVLAAALVGMAFDDLLQVHERFEGRTGLDWQLVYLPVMAFIASAALLLCRRLLRDRAHVALGLLLTGGALWVIAQVLEKLAWVGRVKQPGYEAFMRFEEAFELIGAGLIAVAAIVVLPTREREREEQPPELNR